MLGFAPNGTRPICSLPSSDLGHASIVATATVEARFNNPLTDLMTDPRKHLVFAVEISTLPLDV